jgi:hypothetical protein
MTKLQILNSGLAVSNPQGNVKSSPKDITNVNYLYRLGGFVEGEGCTSIAVSASEKYTFGIQLQPIFNVTQHVSGITTLESFKELFGVGTLHPKSGAPHVYVYDMKGYANMIKFIIPFYELYVLSFGCKIPQFEVFREICFMLDKGLHKDKEGLIKMVRLAYSVQGKGN